MRSAHILSKPIGSHMQSTPAMSWQEKLSVPLAKCFNEEQKKIKKTRKTERGSEGEAWHPPPGYWVGHEQHSASGEGAAPKKHKDIPSLRAVFPLFFVFFVLSGSEKSPGRFMAAITLCAAGRRSGVRPALQMTALFVCEALTCHPASLLRSHHLDNVKLPKVKVCKKKLSGIIHWEWLARAGCRKRGRCLRCGFP